MNEQANPVGDPEEILIVEDSPTQAEKLRYILERRPYRVTTAVDGTHALALLGARKPSLIISDIIMPKMDGYELCNRIKSDESTNDIPVILLTALSNSGDVLEGLSCGADGYISKPYSENYLLSHIEQVLANKRLRKRDPVRVEAEIQVAGNKRLIKTDARQMLTLLLSTHEAAVHRNTELGKAQNELNALNERLEDLVKELKKLEEMKSNTISVVAHELRTPMTSIKNAVDIILTRKAGEINENQEKFLNMAQRNIDRLADLVNDLLDFSKMESGKLELLLTEIDLGQLIEDVVNTLRPLADKKTISLNRTISIDLPSIQVDGRQIEQVLINLLSNSIKFTPEKGVITIEVHRLWNLPNMPDGVAGYVEISVADTGIGIPEEHMPRLFEKFYQVEDSLSKRERHGTGLGLAISKGLVEAQGGSIRVESKEGEGSTFIITLPMIDMDKRIYFTVGNELSKAKRRTTPLSVLILYINDIDSINNIYGEKDNDKVMEMIKDKVISLGIKTTDKIDICKSKNEIVLVMPDTGMAGAQAVLKRINSDFLKDEAANGKYTNFIVASIATYPEDGTSDKELVDCAREKIKKETDMSRQEESTHG